MIGKNSILWRPCLPAVTVSLVCVMVGGTVRSDQDRGPAPGGCCDKTGTFAVQFSVKVDPANHNAVIQLRDGRIVIVRLSDGTFEVRGNRSAIVRATTGDSSTSCGFPLANGRGTVAGFPNVTGRYKELEIAGDAIQGLLELGVAGELPTGQAICYEFTGTRDPSVPDSGAAQVDLAVQFTLQLIRNSPARPLPGYFFGFGRGNTLVLGAGRFLFTGDGTGGFIPAGELPIPVDAELIDVEPFPTYAALEEPPGVIAGLFQASTSLLVGLRVGVVGELEQTFEHRSDTDISDFAVVSPFGGPNEYRIVTWSESGRVDVLRPTGQTLTVTQTIETGLGPITLLGQAGDLNGDDVPDVLAVSTSATQPNQATVTTLLGDVTGVLTVGPSTPVSGCFLVSLRELRMAAGDLNGDGLTDVVIGAQSGTCPAPIATTLLNHPAQPGTFTVLPAFEVPAGPETLSLTLFTPPCAGTPALVANGGVFVGTGDGGFVDSGVRFTLDGLPPTGVLAADVDLNEVVDLTAFYSNDDHLTIQTRSLSELAPRPVLTGVSVEGKNIVAEGSGFAAGSQILVDGVAYKTKADRASPETLLNSKKALKKIRAGTPVTVQVQTPDGVVSEGGIFQR